MAAMAASLMCRGVEKCGSPAPKSTRLTPCARSLEASAATAMVAETSIRPIRSAKILRSTETEVAMSLLSLQILGLTGREWVLSRQFSGEHRRDQVWNDDTYNEPVLRGRAYR